MITPPPAWMWHAKCATTDPDLMYGEEDGGAGDYRKARSICAACPVTTQCLTHALDTGEHYGMWGGLSPDERRNLPARRDGDRGVAAHTERQRRYLIKAARLVALHEAAQSDGVARHILAQRLGIHIDSYDKRIRRARRRLNEAKGTP